MKVPPASIFLDRLICFLMPYFLPMTHDDIELAKAEIIATIADYGARTRAELLNVVQIIAFSMSAMEMLSEAKIATDVSSSLRMRIRGCANNLNRSSHNAEKILASRLKCDAPEYQANAVEPEAADDDLPTEEILRRIDADVAAARAVFDSARTANPAQIAQQPPNKRQKGSPMFDSIFNSLPPPRPTAAA